MVKRALCVGLNYPKQRHQLFGCVNDCLNWENVLRETFAFDELRVLIDQHPDGSLTTAPTQMPTQENILAQLGWLCSGAEPGDCLVFVYAGHGIQVRCPGGDIEEALVPEDFSTSRDGSGNPPLVWSDELHALFARLPPGTFLTVVLDCCHGANMLDVPCYVDTTRRPPRVVQGCDRIMEVDGRHEEDWQKTLIPHALARPRFVPTITLRGPPRNRRVPHGSGAHAGRMTLDPGVTAFCFTAARTAETALDASIKAHQQGVMSFCLLEALQGMRYRCTYEKLLERACAKIEDIRDKYMPMMDQHIQLSFCPNSAPTEVVVLDALYARVAQHKLHQRARLEERGQSGDGRGALAPYARGIADVPCPMNRQASSDFVPSPMYNQAGGQDGCPGWSTNGSAPNGVVGHLYVRVHAGHNLRNRDTGLFGDVSDPYVKVKIGQQEQKTPTIDNDLNPVWTSGNDFGFNVTERDTIVELEVVNANILKDNSLGKVHIDLHTLPLGQWHRRRDRLQNGHNGELEFDIHVARAAGAWASSPCGAPPHGGAGCPAGNHGPCHGLGSPYGNCGHGQEPSHPAGLPLSSAPYTQHAPPTGNGGSCPPYGGQAPYGGLTAYGAPPPPCSYRGGPTQHYAPSWAAPAYDGFGNSAPPGPCGNSTRYGAAAAGLQGPAAAYLGAAPLDRPHSEQVNPYMPDPYGRPYPVVDGSPYQDACALRSATGLGTNYGSVQCGLGGVPADDSNIFGRPNLFGGMPNVVNPAGNAGVACSGLTAVPSSQPLAPSTMGIAMQQGLVAPVTCASSSVVPSSYAPGAYPAQNVAIGSTLSQTRSVYGPAAGAYGIPAAAAPCTSRTLPAAPPAAAGYGGARLGTTVTTAAPTYVRY